MHVRDQSDQHPRHREQSESRLCIANVEIGAHVTRGKFSFAFSLRCWNRFTEKRRSVHQLIVVRKHRITRMNKCRPSLNQTVNPTSHTEKYRKYRDLGLAFAISPPSCVGNDDAYAEIASDQGD